MHIYFLSERKALNFTGGKAANFTCPLGQT